VKGETTATPSLPSPAGGGGPGRGLSAVAALVRRHDRDRYQTALFAPAARREALFALYAFNCEIARVRESVTQPMLGQIRLQWWREVVDAAYAAAPPRRHEVAAPLTAAIRGFALTRDPFDRLIDARERDLADEPFSDLAELEAYAEATSAPLVHLALQVLDGGSGSLPNRGRLARHVGTGYALAGLLRSMPFHDRAGRPRISPAISPSEIAATARRHLEFSRKLVSPRVARPALLPAVIARHYLARLNRAGGDPFARGLQKPDPLQVWRLALANLTGRL